MKSQAARTGVWLVGARGSVATTTIAGAAAFRAGLVPLAGCVSELPDFAGVPLPALGDLVFGGHEVIDLPLGKRAEQLAAAGVLPAELPALVAEDLAATDAEIKPGTPLPGETGGQAAAVARIAADLTDFRDRLGLGRLVVVNVASTEPPLPPGPDRLSWTALRAGLADGTATLPPSSLYACAAAYAGAAFVDFTPSTGARLPALDELAHSRGVPYAGSDGKTGETLVRSVLAPMFAYRALRVRSWSGTNLLGGGDGATLADPATAASKSRSKQRVLRDSLGYPVEGLVHIDHVATMGDWKTAWDHVTFDGFLGVRMSLQFTWQGCDSALAAPLVLDLARFAALALDRGELGPLPALGFFFKDPVASDDHELGSQFRRLRDWAGGGRG